MHLAADRGNPNAQFYLGQLAKRRYEYALAKQYYRCAAAQKHKEAYEELAMRAMMPEENYPKAARYYMEAAKLGSGSAVFRLADVFKEGTSENKRFGYTPDAELSVCFIGKLDIWEKDKSMKFPNLDQECPLPPHPVMGDGSEYPDIEIREPRFLERLQEAPHNPEKEEEMGRERMRWLREEHRYILKSLYGGPILMDEKKRTEQAEISQKKKKSRPKVTDLEPWITPHVQVDEFFVKYQSIYLHLINGGLEKKIESPYLIATMDTFHLDYIPVEQFHDKTEGQFRLWLSQKG